MYDKMFSEILKELRTDSDLTQYELAIKLGCNRQKIADLERGKTYPSMFDLMSLSDIFGVSTDYLLGLSGTKTTDKDIKFICDYTGLSEETLEILHNNKNDNLSSTVNLLVEHKTLELISQYINIIPIDYFKSLCPEGLVEKYIDIINFEGIEDLTNQTFLNKITDSLIKIKKDLIKGL